MNLDGDDALEILVCGENNEGRLFAVVDLQPDGSLPEEPVVAQRSSFFKGEVPEGVDNRPTRIEDACRVADLNEDGHLDLVVPGRLDTARECGLSQCGDSSWRWEWWLWRRAASGVGGAEPSQPTHQGF